MKQEMKSINITFNIDRNYVQHCAATICSIIKSYLGSESITFYVIHNDLTQQDIDDLTGIIPSSLFRLEFISIDVEMLKDMPLGGNTISTSITLSTYFRLMLAAILPKEVKRVIYMDTDVYVNNSIDKLWNFDIQDNAIAGVPEPNQGVKQKRLAIPEGYFYVNAGISIMNLDLLRSIDFPQKAIEYAKANREKIVYHDQDIQNAILYDKTAYIPQRWNMIDPFFFKRLPNLDDKSIDEILKYRNNPSIIHYAGYIKPWHKECQHPYRHLYWQALKGTQWEDAPKISREKDMLKRLKLRIRMILNGNPYCNELNLLGGVIL